MNHFQIFFQTLDLDFDLPILIVPSLVPITPLSPKCSTNVAQPSAQCSAQTVGYECNLPSAQFVHFIDRIPIPSNVDSYCVRNSDVYHSNL